MKLTTILKYNEKFNLTLIKYEYYKGSLKGLTEFYLYWGYNQRTEKFDELVILPTEEKALEFLDDVINANGSKLTYINSQALKNPFNYISKDTTEDDINKFLNDICKFENTVGDDFYQNKSILLVKTVIYYLLEFSDETLRNFDNLYNNVMLQGYYSDDNVNISGLGELFELEERFGNDHKAMELYSDYNTINKTDNKKIVDIALLSLKTWALPLMEVKND